MSTALPVTPDRATVRLPSKVIRPRFVPDEFFGLQPTPTAELPDPRPLIENLTRCVIEILGGARDLEQIARGVTDDVHRHLLKRVGLTSRARAVAIRLEGLDRRWRASAINVL